jgi:hypothetical protein
VLKNDLIHYKITSKPLKILANGNVNGASIPYFSKASFKYRSGRYETSLEFVKNFVFYFVGRLVGDKNCLN